jgi:hypothetical protein
MSFSEVGEYGKIVLVFSLYALKYIFSVFSE